MKIVIKVNHTCTKFVTVRSLKSDNAEKALDDVEDNLVLCMITED